MAARTLPNIGLTAYWPLGDDTWKDGMDANMFALSILAQLVADEFVEGEPAGAEGKVVLTLNAAPIGIYENGAWHYVNAKEGWRAWVKSEDALYVFNGAGWEVVTAGGGGGGGSGLPAGGAPGQVLVKTGGADGAAGWDNLTGKSAYQEAVANGYQGNAASWLASLVGAAGKSAYQVAVDNGFQGNAAAWLASLHGADSTVPGPPGLGVPAGGETGQVLAKTSDADNATAWIDPPEGGGSAEYPPGGNTGQLLAKASPADNDVHWVNPPEGGGGGSSGDANVGFIDTNPPVAHRYWRMRVPVELEGGDAKYWPGFDFLDEDLQPFTGQNWLDREGSRGYMQAGDPNGYVGFGGAPFNITTDLGSAKKLGGMSITPRYGPFQDQAPHHFYMEGSDDNATWITYALVSSIVHGGGERQIFRIRPFLVRFQNASAAAPSTINEIAYSATIGGQTLTTPAVDAISRGRMRGEGGVRTVFNGVTTGIEYGGYWENAWFDYAFDARPSLVTVRLTARETYNGQAPEHFFLKTSRDGINWTTFYESAHGLAFGNNETKSFILPDLPYAGLPETAGSAKKILAVNAYGTGTEWIANRPIKLPIFATTAPAASEVLALMIADEPFTFPAGFSGSVGKALIPPEAGYSLTVNKNGVAIGTVNIATGTGLATFTTSGGAAQAVAVGDVISVVGSGSADSAIRNLAVTLKGAL
jgi:hypothetical protein